MEERSKESLLVGLKSRSLEVPPTALDLTSGRLTSSDQYCGSNERGGEGGGLECVQ